MSATAPVTQQVKPVSGALRWLAIVVIVAGAVLAVGGTITWFVIRHQLVNERIVTPKDASIPNKAVQGPLTAYSMANIINHHAMEITGGKTFAQLPQDDPRRVTVQTASFLRASLFTSVLAFGVAAMAGGLGILFVIIGWALFSLSRSLSAPTAGTPPPATAGS